MKTGVLPCAVLAVELLEPLEEFRKPSEAAGVLLILQPPKGPMPRSFRRSVRGEGRSLIAAGSPKRPWLEHAGNQVADGWA